MNYKSARRMSSHIRFLRSFNGETAVSIQPIQAVLGKAWEADETIEFQILLDRNRRFFCLVPRITLKPPGLRRNLSGAPGTVRCFQQPYDTGVIRFCSRSLRREMGIQAGQAYPIHPRKAKGWLLVRMDDPPLIYV